MKNSLLQFFIFLLGEFPMYQIGSQMLCLPGIEFNIRSKILFLILWILLAHGYMFEFLFW
jgi:hypothetical protein